MKRIVCALLGVLLALSGCAVTMDSGLDNVETMVIDSPLGYRLTLPADWQEVISDEDNLAQSYLSSDGMISLFIRAELGGMEYNSLKEIGSELSSLIKDAAFSAAELDETADDKRYTATICGTDQSGSSLVNRIDIFAPYASVRYYLLFTVAGSVYEDNKQLLTEIANSFSVTLAQEDSYQMIEDMRDAAAETENAPDEELLPEQDDNTKN